MGVDGFSSEMTLMDCRPQIILEFLLRSLLMDCLWLLEHILIMAFLLIPGRSGYLSLWTVPGYRREILLITSLRTPQVVAGWR